MTYQSPFVRWLWGIVQDHPDLTQNDLARRIGVSPSRFSDWLNGKSLPHRSNERKLAAFAGVPLSHVRTLTCDSEVASPSPSPEPPIDVDLRDPELTLMMDQVGSELTQEEQDFLKELIRAYLERRRRRAS